MFYRYLQQNTNLQGVGNTVGSLYNSGENSNTIKGGPNHEKLNKLIEKERLNRKRKQEEIITFDNECSSASNLQKDIEDALSGLPSYLPDVIRENITPSVASTSDINARYINTNFKKTLPITNKTHSNSRNSSNFSLINKLSSNYRTLHSRVEKKIKVNHGDKPDNILCGDRKVKPFSLESFSERTEKCWCGETNSLYDLKCSHFICRSCLLREDSSVILCKTCNNKINKKDISKYNHKSIFSL